jgi:hypothetical protein
MNDIHINYPEHIKFWLNSDEIKLIDDLLRRLQLEGAKNIRVISNTNDFFSIGKGKEVFIKIHHLKYSSRIYVYYYEDGKLHRLDGSAFQDYRICDNKLILASQTYYYKHNLCFLCLHEEDKTKAIFYGSIVLDEERLSTHVFLKKVLTLNDIFDQYFWVKNVT